MDLLIKFLLGLVGAFNFIMNIRKVIQYGLNVRKQKSVRNHPVEKVAMTKKACNTKVALRNLQFYTNYNDLLVPTIKGI